MKTRQLGRSGLTVSAIGLRCMGMPEFYSDRDDARALKTNRPRSGNWAELQRRVQI